MRLRHVFAAAAAVSVLAFGFEARAEQEFSVSASKGSIEVVAKAPWHINKAAPWKVVASGTTLDKSKFTLTESSAKVQGVPAGDAKVKIYVCSGDQCKNFETTVAVK